MTSSLEQATLRQLYSSSDALLSLADGLAETPCDGLSIATKLDQEIERLRVISMLLHFSTEQVKDQPRISASVESRV